MRIVVACAVGSLALASCSSTEDKAAKFIDEGSKAFEAKGLQVKTRNASVKVEDTQTTWINDQVLPPAGTAAAVKARVGTAKAAPADLPKLSVSAPRLEGDPVDGVAARGELVNDSKVEQKDLVLYGLARKGGKVAAAGRAVVPRLRAGAKARYAIFFIGDPRGAKLDVSAPPTTLRSAG